MPDSLSTEDRLAVQELVARYAWALDTSDPDLMVSLFTPDGTFVGELGSYTGGAELRAWVEARDQSLRATQHVVSNLMLSLNGGEIVERSLCLIVGPIGTGAAVQSSGFYRGRVVKHDGQWLFATRSFHHFEP